MKMEVDELVQAFVTVFCELDHCMRHGTSESLLRRRALIRQLDQLVDEATMSLLVVRAFRHLDESHWN